MKKLLFPLLLAAAMLPAQAADYFLPDAECDGSANVRAAPDTRSKILAELDSESPQRKILGRQGKWLRIQLNGGRTGYVHQSQGYIVQNYIVASPDGSANVRAAPDTHSKILAVLDSESPQRKILGRQGGWFHIRLNNGRTGYVHQSQGYIVQNYIVASHDGAGNVRSIDPGYPVGRAPVIKTLPNGTRVQIVPGSSKGSWLLYDNQGAYTENVDAAFQGYIHKSQLRRAD